MSVVVFDQSYPALKLHDYLNQVICISCHCMLPQDVIIYHGNKPQQQNRNCFHQVHLSLVAENVLHDKHFARDL